MTENGNETINLSILDFKYKISCRAIIEKVIL